MHVRLLIAMAGPQQAWAGGDLYECDEATAARFIAAGIAAPVAPVVEAGPVETASVEPAERAVRPRGRPRKV